MSFGNEVFSCMLLSDIDFEIKQLIRNALSGLRHLSFGTTLMGAVALAYAPVSGTPAATTTVAATSSAATHAGAVTFSQAHAFAPPDDATGQCERAVVFLLEDAGIAHLL